MHPNLEIAGELYRALRDQDIAALVQILHPSFTAEVSEGMPLGVGGDIRSPEAMLRDVWGRVAAEYEVAPEPSELVLACDDRVFAIGRYRGHVRGAGADAVDAAFVHVLELRDGRVSFLKQVTDTARWARASGDAA